MIIPKWIKKIRRNFNPYKSQKGQDRWVVNEILGGMRKGYFLDLAAADGITHSNTHVLEKKYGWNGICIEPNPFFYDKLVDERNCICEKVAISDKIEKVDFRVDNGQLGGIIAEGTDNNNKIRRDELKTATIIEMECMTLEMILNKNNSPKVIDYFSLDIEGSEEKIISSFNFDNYKFKCITIERPTVSVNEILFKNDYAFVKNFQFDSFYVHNSIKDKFDIKCNKFEQVPPKNW